MLLKNKRIFMVEDDANNLAVMATILQQQGAVTAFERWGHETFKRLEAFAPVDLIILDLMFPDGVTGYDVYGDIRRMPEFTETPVVIVSAADPAVEMPKAREVGIAGFISKPIRFGTFERQIKQVMDGEQIWHAR